jgi:voltage-gated potassium channel
MSRSRAEQPTPNRRVSAVDWIMVGLALMSVLILVTVEAFGFLLEGRPEWRLWLIYADVGLCGVFLIEFLVQMARAPSRRDFVKGRWYDLIGMVPISHPLLRGFRLFRIVRIVVVLSRVSKTSSRAFGEAAVENLVRRYREVFIEAIEGRIMLASLDIVEPPLTRSRLPARIADALDKRRGELRTTVHQSLQKVPVIRHLMKLNVSQDLLGAVEDVVLETVVTALRSDELNRVVQESFEVGIEELRRAVRDKEDERASAGTESTNQLSSEGQAAETHASGLPRKLIG